MNVIVFLIGVYGLLYGRIKLTKHACLNRYQARVFSALLIIGAAIPLTFYGDNITTSMSIVIWGLAIILASIMVQRDESQDISKDYLLFLNVGISFVVTTGFSISLLAAFGWLF